MVKKSLVALFVSLMISIFCYDQLAHGNQIKREEDDGVPGTWYVGEEPETQKGKPILFVHGLTGMAAYWYEMNDIHEYAFEAGHPTAYINLYPTESNWDNGELLATKIQDIQAHFGEDLIVIGHSKGGVDTQTALMHYGAEEYVSQVFTLGTPHYGSPLADLAYSNWTWWLAEIIGVRNAGTDSLRTAEMAQFRLETDRRITEDSVPFQTMSGRSWGPFGSSQFFGGLYLSAFGPNDGLVTVDHSRLTYADEIASLPLDHMQIAQGSLIFSYLQPNFESEKAIQSLTESESSSHIIRGGNVLENSEQKFQFEEDIDHVTLSVLADKPLETIRLQSPSGDVLTNQPKVKEEKGTIFAGAYSHFFSVSSPESGEWTVMMGDENDAVYLAVATIEGGITVSNIEAINRTYTQIDSRVDRDSTTYTLHINDRKIVEDEPLSTMNTLETARDDNQTFTLDLKGVTKEGISFERTLISP